MRYWTIEKTISTIHKASDKQLIFIVCENPQDVLKLVEGGVPIKKVNIGNMHMADGKRQVAGSVAVDDDRCCCICKAYVIWVWNSRFVVFRPRQRRTLKSCSNKL